jgi:carbonic anhydrase
MNGTAQLLANNEAYASSFGGSDLAAPPALKLAMGTEEAVLLHHTDCGMMTFTDEEFAQAREHDVGQRPPWPARTFASLEDDVRDSIERIRSSPFIPRKQSVRGFVYEVESGRVREVS